MNRLNQKQTTNSLWFMRCGIGEETYGMDTSWVRSIQRIDRLRRDPEAASPTMNQTSESVGPVGHSPVGWLPGEEGAASLPSISKEGAASLPFTSKGAASLPSISKGDIPVFSLASRLGRPPSFEREEGGTSQRIIVLHPPPSLPQMEGSQRGQPWALLVDHISQVIQISADRVVPLPAIVADPSAGYFQGVILSDGRLTLFLAPERLHPDALPNAGGPLREAKSPGLTSTPSARPTTASAEGPRPGRGQILVFYTTEPDPAERALAFGLSISQVPEILGSLPLIPVPGAAACVLGLANWRSRPVPVIDLADRLGLGPSLADGRARFIIARDRGSSGESSLIGFLVRPAIRLLRLPVPHHASSRSLSIDPALTRGIVELESETLVIPDVHTITRAHR